MTPDLVERKRTLRRQILERLRQVSPEEIVQASARLCAQLRPQTVWRDCQSLLAFFPMPGEPDIRPLLEEALTAGKTVALPRFNSGRGDSEARVVPDLSALRPAHFGILEPGPECSPIELNRLDFFLVPGVGYDVNGRRLGRGKGYFDRLLAQVRGHKCGVALEWQVVAEVPVGPHDVRMNSLLTPLRWFRCAD